ncbi:Yqey-like protein-domain-containing protein [Infundibulicybe gibba]|nr:Yqey-like protein-domain-containing protein [Infundibulicybe gibba]
MSGVFSEQGHTLINYTTVLSDVYAADKTTGQKLASPMIVSILRKGITRRNDAAAKFNQASRFDLAEQELREAAILTQFLPPSLPQEEVDRALVEAITQLPPGADPRKSLGMVFKIFFSNVDKSLIDTETVKRRAQELLAQRT